MDNERKTVINKIRVSLLKLFCHHPFVGSQSSNQLHPASGGDNFDGLQREVLALRNQLTEKEVQVERLVSVM